MMSCDPLEQTMRRAYRWRWIPRNRIRRSVARWFADLVWQGRLSIQFMNLAMWIERRPADRSVADLAPLFRLFAIAGCLAISALIPILFLAS